MISKWWKGTKDVNYPVAKNDNIVSVHIPKTAGTSFRMLLVDLYGAEQVLRVDYPIRDPQLRVNGEVHQLEQSISAPVIHGHFNYSTLRPQLTINQKTKLITWVRDPVERVISNYFYLKERLIQELDEKGRGLNILSKMTRSLSEYASDEMNRNIQFKFLDGTDIEQFYFIGITENFDHDIDKLAEMLKWPSITYEKVNKTSKKEQVSEQVRKHIAELNEKDMSLYHRVKDWRAI